MADLLGYAASCAVLATFLMRTMVPLRLVAIVSNLLFLGFGYIQNIHPVFFLHMALLPINVWGLVAWHDRPAAPLPLNSPGPAGAAAWPHAFWFVIGLAAGLFCLGTVIIFAHPQHG